LRPATAIIRKFVISAPHLRSPPGKPIQTPSRRKGKEKAEGPEEVDRRFGFDAIWRRMEGIGAGLEGEGNEMERAWRVVVKRMEGTGDLELVALT
jgi:hypothetical protein